MTPASFDTRRRLLGLSIQEAADYFGVKRRTVERWISGYSEINPKAIEILLDLEDNMITASEKSALVAANSGQNPIHLIRYRSQQAVDSSPHAAGLTLGAHAILVGWTADALEADGFTVEIVWGD